MILSLGSVEISGISKFDKCVHTWNGYDSNFLNFNDSIQNKSNCSVKKVIIFKSISNCISS